MLSMFVCSWDMLVVVSVGCRLFSLRSEREPMCVCCSCSAQASVFACHAVYCQLCACCGIFSYDWRQPQ
jgi:hypothetical protein